MLLDAGYFPPVRVLIRAHDAELANQIPSLEPWPMTRLSCYLAWQKPLCSVTQRLRFSMHTAKGPKNQRTYTKHALDNIQSFSHNQLLGWHVLQCTNKSAVLERGMNTSQNSSLRLYTEEINSSAASWRCLMFHTSWQILQRECQTPIQNKVK